MKILLIEDSKDQQDIFKNSVEVFNDKNDLRVEYEIAEDIQDALNKIDGSYDGTIIDLKLREEEDGGNEIVRQLGSSFTRIPIIFVTGFVDLVNDHPAIIKKRARADETYESDLILFKQISNTGITRIMGGRGIIEETLSQVFLENLLPQKDTWINYGEDNSSRTEKALLRYALNHLLQLLDDDEGRCYPEEVYLYPPLTEEVRTGSILREKESDKWLAVMSPACDLVIREDGCRNTDIILIAEIDSMTTLFPWFQGTKGLSNTKRRKLEDAFANSKFYYHWLPETDFFEGGFLNFRKLSTLEIEQLQEQFHLPPKIQISPPFVKDIVARFSSYYARQGQPNIDFTKFTN